MVTAAALAWPLRTIIYMKTSKISFLLFVVFILLVVPKKSWAPTEEMFMRFKHCIPSVVASTVTYTVAESEDQMQAPYSSDNNCSLREAIYDAHLFYKDYDIQINLSPVTSNTFFLNLAGDNEDLAFKGDIDIDHPNAPVTISGLSGVETIIDAEGLGDRIFEILEGTQVTISNVTLKNGYVCSDINSDSLCFGGAIFNRGTLTLDNVHLTENTAGDSKTFHARGGALYNEGSLTMDHVLLDNNLTANNYDDQKNSGGALYSTGDLLIQNSTISENLNNGIYGGALFIDTSFADAMIQNTSILNNACISYKYGCHGAGVYATGNISHSNSLTLSNTTIANNTTNLTFIDAQTTSMPALGGGLFAAGNLVISNVTIADNGIQRNGYSNTIAMGAGIFLADHTKVALNNTLIAGNFTTLNSQNTVSGFDLGFNQQVLLTTNGANLIENAILDTLPLAATDQIGTARAELIDTIVTSGEYGKSHYPLLNGGKAVDAGLAADCSTTDQLGKARSGTACDIGAVECVGCSAYAVTATSLPPSGELEHTGTLPSDPAATSLTPTVETTLSPTAAGVDDLNNAPAIDNSLDINTIDADALVGGANGVPGCSLQTNATQNNTTVEALFALSLIVLWRRQRLKVLN